MQKKKKIEEEMVIVFSFFSPLVAKVPLVIQHVQFPLPIILMRVRQFFFIEHDMRDLFFRKAWHVDFWDMAPCEEHIQSMCSYLRSLLI